MKYRQLGRTGIIVSEIGLGCGGLKPDDPRNLEYVVEYAFEQGVNFFDTADIYQKGASEEILGRVFANRRDKVIFATKFCTVFGKDGKPYKDVSVQHMHEALKTSLKRLRTDYIDVYQLHNPPMSVLDNHELFSELDKLVELGVIRCYGISIDTGKEAIQFLDSTNGSVVQMIFNLFHQEARNFFLDEAKKRGAGVIVKVPLAGGTLSGAFNKNYPPPEDERRKRWGEEEFQYRLELVEKVRPVLEKNGRTLAQGALAWLLSFDAVSVVIPGITSLERVKENIGAGGMRLTEDEIRALDEMEGGLIRRLLLRW
jgi:aryl-alcohol dehydrogenase-like predicted oxidoreductase